MNLQRVPVNIFQGPLPSKQKYLKIFIYFEMLVFDGYKNLPPSNIMGIFYKNRKRLDITTNYGVELDT